MKPSELKLQVGGLYHNRNGELIRILRDTGTQIFKFVGQTGATYREDGTFSYFEGVSTDEDLVHEVMRKSEIPALTSTPTTRSLIADFVLDLVLDEVGQERVRQDAKWGQQNHFPSKWLAILAEEFGEVARAICEAGAEKVNNKSANWANYREELIQVAAVAVAMVESFDRNQEGDDDGEES